MPLKGEPKNHYIKTEKKSKIGELKEKLGQLAGIATDRLLLADVYHGRIFQLLNDEASVSAIRDTDVTYAYALILMSNIMMINGDNLQL